MMYAFLYITVLERCQHHFFKKYYKLEASKRRTYPADVLGSDVLIPAALETTGAFGTGMIELLNVHRMLLQTKLDKKEVGKKIWWLRRKLGICLQRHNANMFLRHARNQCPDHFAQYSPSNYYDIAAVQADVDGLHLLDSQPE